MCVLPILVENIVRIIFSVWIKLHVAFQYKADMRYPYICTCIYKKISRKVLIRKYKVHFFSSKMKSETHLNC